VGDLYNQSYVWLSQRICIESDITGPHNTGPRHALNKQIQLPHLNYPRVERPEYFGQIHTLLLRWPTYIYNVPILPGDRNTFHYRRKHLSILPTETLHKQLTQTFRDSFKAAKEPRTNLHAIYLLKCMAMNGSQSRRLRRSLGASWEDAEYVSDGGASIHSASEFETEPESDSDREDKRLTPEQEEQESATPIPTRVTRASSRQPQDSPIKTPTHRLDPRASVSSRATPRSQTRSKPSPRVSSTAEPAFIMPSMHGSTSARHHGSPLQNSETARNRKRNRDQSRSSGISTSSHMPRRQPASSFTTNQKPAGQPVNIWHYVDLFRQHLLAPFLGYLFSLLGHTAQMLKPFFAVLLTLWLIGFALTSASKTFSNAVSSVLSPVCILPGSSYIMPFCGQEHTKPEGKSPAIDELMKVQLEFEKIMDGSVEYSSLPSTMKSAEVAMRDVRTLVKYSRLPSKAELGVEFDSFIETARQASHDLVKFKTKTAFTLDKVLSTNRWTMRVLTGLQEKQASIGMLDRAVSAINPFSAFVVGRPSLDEQIWEQFIQHISVVKEDITKLMHAGHALLSLLDNMDQRLDVMNQIATRDNTEIESNHDVLLTELWTRLGGNSAQRKGYERQLQLLREVGSYRELAIRHVSSAILKLQEMSQELEHLRDGVAAPEVMGSGAGIPLEHFLEVMGDTVARLDAKRGETHALDMAAYKKTMKDGGIGYKAETPELPGRTEELPLIYAKQKY
jgi:hypothetical protein